MLVGVFFVLCGVCGCLSAQDLNAIEHIVIFMQENRAFDHYYGHLRGVRGFDDRAVIRMPSGRSSFYQPLDDEDVEYMLPWHMNSLTTNGVCGEAPQMDYPTDISMWDNGKLDQWNIARDPGLGMSFFKRADLPYYYELIDGFTVGDQYFQSTFTQTNPNRLHLFSGSNGLSVGQSPVLDNSEPKPGFTWETMGETLENAGISWYVYQEQNNFDDNGFAWFAAYQEGFNFFRFLFHSIFSFLLLFSLLFRFYFGSKTHIS
jgi:phospholipase C